MNSMSWTRKPGERWDERDKARAEQFVRDHWVAPAADSDGSLSGSSDASPAQYVWGDWVNPESLSAPTIDPMVDLFADIWNRYKPAHRHPPLAAPVPGAVPPEVDLADTERLIDHVRVYVIAQHLGARLPESLRGQELEDWLIGSEVCGATLGRRLNRSVGKEEVGWFCRTHLRGVLKNYKPKKGPLWDYLFVCFKHESNAAPHRIPAHGQDVELDGNDINLPVAPNQVNDDTSAKARTEISTYLSEGIENEDTALWSEALILYYTTGPVLQQIEELLTNWAFPPMEPIAVPPPRRFAGMWSEISLKIDETLDQLGLNPGRFGFERDYSSAAILFSLRTQFQELLGALDDPDKELRNKQEIESLVEERLRDMGLDSHSKGRVVDFLADQLARKDRARLELLSRLFRDAKKEQERNCITVPMHAVVGLILTLRGYGLVNANYSRLLILRGHRYLKGRCARYPTSIAPVGARFSDPTVFQLQVRLNGPALERTRVDVSWSPPDMAEMAAVVHVERGWDRVNFDIKTKPPAISRPTALIFDDNTGTQRTGTILMNQVLVDAAANGRSAHMRIPVKPHAWGPATVNVETPDPGASVPTAVVAIRADQNEASFPVSVYRDKAGPVLVTVAPPDVRGGDTFAARLTMGARVTAHLGGAHVQGILPIRPSRRVLLTLTTSDPSLAKPESSVSSTSRTLTDIEFNSSVVGAASPVRVIASGNGLAAETEVCLLQPAVKTVALWVARDGEKVPVGRILAGQAVQGTVTLDRKAGINESQGDANDPRADNTTVEIAVKPHPNVSLRRKVSVDGGKESVELVQSLELDVNCELAEAHFEIEASPKCLDGLATITARTIARSNCTHHEAQVQRELKIQANAVEKIFFHHGGKSDITSVNGGATLDGVVQLRHAAVIDTSLRVYSTNRLVQVVGAREEEPKTRIDSDGKTIRRYSTARPTLDIDLKKGSKEATFQVRTSTVDRNSYVEIGAQILGGPDAKATLLLKRTGRASLGNC